MNSKLEAALKMAKAGFYVFPLVSDRKIPISGCRWKIESTRNADKLREWWGKQDNNIGIDCGKSGVFVVDIDVKGGKKGNESFLALNAKHRFTATLTSLTPSGGKHLIYYGQGYRNTTNYPALGIDIRCDGGYIVAPGSTIDGKAYEWDRSVPAKPVPLDPWLSYLMARKRSIAPAQTSRVITSDDPADIGWAIDFLKEHEPAIEGAAGDNHTYVTFCRLKERGISLPTALELAAEHWNPRCAPPWEYNDLKRKANSAYTSAQNATGAKSALAEFGDAPVDVGKNPNVEAKRSITLTPYKPLLASEILPRDWVFGQIACRKFLTIIVAPPGTGKSSLTLSIGVSKASGKNILGIDPRGQGRVAIYNNEDPLEEMNRRVFAIMQANSVFPQDLTLPNVTESEDSNLYINSGEETPFRVARRAQGGEIKSHHADEMVQLLIERKIDLLIIDPFSETHPAEENSNEEVGRIGAMFRAIAQRANCSIILVHHTRKLSEASADGHSGNLDSMRGASALAGVARMVFTFNALSQKMAKKYGIEEDRRGCYLIFEQAKNNLAAPTANQHFFERIGECVNPTEDNPDGENIGVLKPVLLTALPQKFLKVSEEKLLQIVHESFSASPVAPICAKKIGEAFCAWFMDVKKISRLKTAQQAYYRAREKLVAAGYIRYAEDSGSIHVHKFPQAGIAEIASHSTYPHAPLKGRDGVEVEAMSYTLSKNIEDFL